MGRDVHAHNVLLISGVVSSGRLYDDRGLVKQLARRRTLFVFPRDLLAAAWPSASARVAGIERTRMSKDAVRAELAEDGDDWLDRARAEVLAVLADAPEGRPAREVRQTVTMIDVKMEVSPTAAGSASVAPASRVLTHLGATADIVRGTNTGHWRTSRPRWTLMRHWVDGRVVGCWVQDDSGVVEVRLLERVSARARHTLEAEAARLTAWLGGVRIKTLVPSPAMKSGH
jgi:hypothetical protein